VRARAERPVERYEKPGRLLARLWREVRPYKGLLFLGMFLTMLQSAFAFIPPLILGDIVNKLQAGVRIDPWSYLWYVIGFASGAGLMSYAVGLVNQRLGQTFLLNIREKLYSHMQSLPIGYFERRQPGKLVSNVMNDPSTIYNLLVTNVNTMASDSVQFVLVLFVLFSISPFLACLALIAAPLYVYNVWVTLKPISRTSEDIRSMRDEMFGDMQEKLTGIQVVKGFGKERWEVRSFHGLTRGLMDANVEQSALGTRMWTIAEGLGGIGQALILYFGGLMALDGRMQAGTLVMFLLYSVGYVYGPVVRTLLVLDPLARTFAALARIFRTLDTKNPIVTREGASHMPPIRGEVEFEDVWFEYVPNTPVIKGLRLRVEPGELVAFVGFSGSGKTTLANLLMRHYDPQSGRVLVDGHDVREVDLLSYRRQIGYVIQESLLFDTTVRENVRYGRLDATDDEVVDAAKAANAHEAIESLPQGYDTPLGEKGVDLSQGEKQRLAIARALLADPRILILDEATSSLDSKTESLVQEALERLLRGRTSFVIAHRLSTVVKADRIVVLEDGRITAIGRHAELLKDADGLYARMFRQQFAVALSTQSAAGES
jgi:subfamily B ATP-binding cassette protein MsbA